jgi:hypothetical protein
MSGDQRDAQLAQIAKYVHTNFDVDLMDLFFTAMESLDVES